MLSPGGVPGWESTISWIPTSRIEDTHQPGRRRQSTTNPQRLNGLSKGLHRDLRNAGRLGCCGSCAPIQVEHLGAK